MQRRHPPAVRDREGSEVTERPILFSGEMVRANPLVWRIEFRRV